jgi:hypothetical protein
LKVLTRKDISMTHRSAVVFMTLFVSLSGCAKDRSLAPPADSEQMTITVKVPDELKARTLEAMYRSATCKRITHGASGQRIELQGYHGIEVQLEQQGESDLYQVRLPMDGGGACQWHLSNVTFGVAYVDPGRFGESVTYGTGGGVVVMFDNNRPSRSPGLPKKVDGDLIIKKDYYPWLSETFLGGYKKDINLAGEGSGYFFYKAVHARQIYFEPVLHSRYAVRSEGAKVHKVGSYMKFIYPDGSIAANGHYRPDFRKLQAIRQAAENK